MYALTLYGIAIGSLGLVGASNIDPVPIIYQTSDQSSAVLVQGSTGSGSPSTANKGLDTGKSGTHTDTNADKGKFGRQGSKSDQPTSGKQSFGSDQPASGDFSPNPSASTTAPGGQQDKRGNRGTGESASNQQEHGSSQQ
jgi:hypothetical protein